MVCRIAKINILIPIKLMEGFILKKFLFTILALLMTAFIIGCSGDEDVSNDSSESNVPEETASEESQDTNGDGITIKLAHASAPGSGRDQGAHKFKEVVEAETNGEVTVEIYPASQLGSPDEQMQAVQLGNLEMAVLPTSFMGGFQPLITLLDIPFLFPNDRDKLIEIQQSDEMRQLLDKTEEVGIKTLGIWHTGYMQFTGPKAFKSPEDFEGVKFRAMPSPVMFEKFRVLGASPTDLAFAETYNALQTDIIDAQENPLDTTYDMKLHEVQDVVTLTDHGVLDQLLLINNDFYNSLDQSVKDAMDKGFKEGLEVTVNATYERIEEVRQEMEESGIEFVEVSESERQTLIDALAPVKDFFIEEFGDEGKELLEAIESLK